MNHKQDFGRHQVFSHYGVNLHYFFSTPIIGGGLLCGDYLLLDSFFTASGEIDGLTRLMILLIALIGHLLFYEYLKEYSPSYGLLQERGLVFYNFFHEVFVRFEEIESVGQHYDDADYPGEAPSTVYVKINLNRITPLGQTIKTCLRPGPIAHGGKLFSSFHFLRYLVDYYQHPNQKKTRYVRV